jgi:hypothetical protein
MFFCRKEFAVSSGIMKKKISIVLFLFLLSFSGCKNVSNHTPQPGQGTITYSVTYPDSIKYGFKSAFFPKEIILVFKDEKATFIASGALGMVQLVNIMDHKTQKFTSLLIDNLRDNYACNPTADEIKENEQQAEYTFELKDETKTVAGLNCNKAVVKDISENKSFNVYYYDKIRFYYWNSPFKDFNYLLMEYEHTINNLTLKLAATKVDFTTPVDTSLFSVKGDYRWVSQKEFYALLGRL